MDTALLMEYIRRRMEELGYGTHYNIRFRHFVLQTSEIKEIAASEHFYFLIEQTGGVTIESAFGYFDLGTKSANELQYEHQGKITMTNYSPVTCHVRFVQAIPKTEQICQQ